MLDIKKNKNLKNLCFYEIWSSKNCGTLQVTERNKDNQKSKVPNTEFMKWLFFKNPGLATTGFPKETKKKKEGGKNSTTYFGHANADVAWS